MIVHVKFVSIPTMDQDRALAFYTEKLGFNGALACDNVQKTYDELKGRGVEFDSPPQGQPWGTFAIS